MKNPFRRQRLGDRGEQAAVRFLKRLGLRILATGCRNAWGEIDIIALDGSCIVFVEVKTRSSHDAGQPCDAVDRRKQQRITLAALGWLRKQRRLEQPARFDVISILWPDGTAEPDIRHFPHAFEASGRWQFFR